MKDLVILTSIIVFWFFLGSILTFIAADSTLSTTALFGNASYEADLTDFNLSDEEVSGTTNPLTLWDSLSFLFGFKSPTTDFPSGLKLFVNFLNWFLVIMAGVILYRLIRSGAG